MRLIIGKNAKDSLNRPAWTQDDIHAYKHLYIRDKIINNYYHKNRR